ncbi:MAG: iron-sulfur cluster assembly accessory protein [Pseudomonadota bacterium]|nr:iron-sulfur cluster assembly accessory protein [Pseudomonadota bacterium]
MKLSLTAAAAQHFKRLLAPEPASKGILVALEKAGCAGYMYRTEVASKPEDSIEVVCEGLRFFVPNTSVPRLNHMRIDIEKNRLESKLVFQNPNVSMQCGCGESVELLESSK